MTTKIISNYYASGYTISAGVTVLTIEGGGVGGPGVTGSSSVQINNYATVTGINLTAGGTVKNSAVVSGQSGHSVNITGGAGLIENYGTIKGPGVLITGTVVNSGVIGAVTLSGGGLVDNKALALIGGVTATGSAATVDNYGKLIATGAYGVNLKAGGTVKNGVFGIIYSDIGVSIAGAAGVVKNYGTILAYPQGQGVALAKGGTVTNGSTGDTRALIEGALFGVYGGGAATTLANFGTIQATEGTYTANGVLLNSGGSVTNGGSSDWTALISGYSALYIQGGAATVTNFGTIAGTGDPLGTGTVSATGVGLGESGAVTNGSVTDRAALITGADDGIAVNGLATVNNFGTIEGTGVSASHGSGGVHANGGKLTNGALGDQSALVLGYASGVDFQSAVGTVVNFGTIESTETVHSAAVVLLAGGSVTNGAAGDTTALLSGCYGVYSKLAASVTNFGTIAGTIKYGVTGAAGGTVTNGGLTDTRALIEGSTGVLISLGAGTISNFGALHGQGAAAGYAGAYLKAGGKITNGALGDRVATIDGYSGLITAGASTTVVNFATINGVGQAGQAGALLNAAGSLTNGAVTDSAALIEGYVGVTGSGVATVTNFGTIEGTGGVAIQFKAAGDVLVDEAGSTFLGTVLGDGATLTLAGVGGTLSGFSPAAGATFQNFATINVAAGASFTLTGSATLAATAKLIDSGALSIGAGGSLTSLGAISGAGALILSGGAATVSGGLTVASVSLANPASVATVTKSLAYAGVWTQSAGTLTAAAGAALSFTGVGDTFSGTVGGGGSVSFTSGTDTLANVTLAATSMSLKSTTVNLVGAINFAGVVSATSSGITVAAGGATLTGGGSLFLASAGGAIVQGATSAATLTNVSNKILGAGVLGNGVMTLVNNLGGLIDANGSAALIINTGANAVTNAGIIETTGAGGLTISSALANTGTLTVTTGVLSVTGAVTGAGTLRIGGGTADFTSSFTENVAFIGAIGVLELGQSQGYTGQVSGFSKTGAESLDLLDIVFGASTKATFSGSSASGVLTVTDGTHTSKITLIGNYTGSTFTASSDGHGGTTVVDPTVGRTPPAFPLIAAMASFGGAAPASTVLVAAAPPPAASFLARP